MLNGTIYLDYNATAPLLPAVKEAMSEALGLPLNASSVHAHGRAARKYIEQARAAVAEAFNCFPGEVLFTASATEAHNTALRGIGAERVLVSAVEHASILRIQDPGFKVEIFPVDEHGEARLDIVEEMLKQGAGKRTLLSLMLANNETGVLQSVHEAAILAHRYGALIHTDAVQAVGKIPVDFSALEVDLLSFSTHKMGGPLGAAALLVRQGVEITPLLMGGGQESGRRAGTENVVAIAGLAAAVGKINWSIKRGEIVEEAVRAMEWELEAEGASIVGKRTLRLPNTSCLLMPGVPGETQLMAFDLAGISVSSGAACSSGKVKASHVLQAMGLPKDEAATAIRVSTGWATEPQHLHIFAEQWKKLKSRTIKKAANQAKEREVA